MQCDRSSTVFTSSMYPPPTFWHRPSKGVGTGWGGGRDGDMSPLHYQRQSHLSESKILPRRREIFDFVIFPSHAFILKVEHNVLSPARPSTAQTVWEAREAAASKWRHVRG